MMGVAMSFPLPLLEVFLARALRKEFKPPVTIFIENTLDQDVTIQVKGNRTKSTSGAVKVGDAFTVAAKTNDARTLIPDVTGWLPYIYVEVSCTAAPTEGTLTIYLVRSKEDQVKLVDNLAIRDTNTHSPDTDPNNMFIHDWG